METFAIGDIHGGLRALKQLIDKLPLTGKSTLIFLGDYADGWPEVKQLIDYLIELQTRFHCIFIKGNHDEWCEEWLTTGIEPAEWNQYGGKGTKESYENISQEDLERHINFFSKTVYYYFDTNKNLFVHAGFTSQHGHQKEYFKSNFAWDRSLWEMLLAADRTLTPDSIFYPKRITHYNQIFIGHTPVTKHGFTLPVNIFNVWNIDTGAAFKGKISAINIESHEVYQSDCVQALYPDYEGRKL